MRGPGSGLGRLQAPGADGDASGTIGEVAADGGEADRGGGGGRDGAPAAPWRPDVVPLHHPGHRLADDPLALGDRSGMDEGGTDKADATSHFGASWKTVERVWRHMNPRAKAVRSV